MRHNRKAVMAERYKLYMKKHIFNGRYFVRNLQIGICTVLAVALIIGVVVLAYSGKEKQTVTASADIKEALFSNGKEEKTITKKENTEESVTTSEEILETNNTEEVPQKSISSEPITDADNNIEDTIQPEEEIEKKSDFDGKCIANVEGTLNIRKTPGTDAEFAGSMKRGAIAKVEGTQGEWTKIKSGEVEGYVLTQYILTGEDAEQFAKDYVTLQGTILKDGVNIRKKESTDADILTVLDKDDTITVLEEPETKKQEENKVPEEKKEEPSQTVTTVVDTEEKDSEDTKNTTETFTQETVSQVSVEKSSETVTEEETSEASTEEKTLEKPVEQVKQEQKDVESSVQTDKKEEESEITWLCVMLADGQRGYVSDELVNVESLYEIAVSAEELERKAAEEAAAKKAAEEEAARQEAARQAAAQTANSGSKGNSDSNSSDSYKGASTTPVTTTESGECIGTFTITAYCGCKKCSGGGKKTASGTTPTEGRTIAADPSVLPYGTQVVIGGVVYTVEDCGSGVNGNHIDIFFATHSKALAFGRKSMKVYKY